MACGPAEEIPEHTWNVPFDYIKKLYEEDKNIICTMDAATLLRDFYINVRKKAIKNVVYSAKKYMQFPNAKCGHKDKLWGFEIKLQLVDEYLGLDLNLRGEGACVGYDKRKARKIAAFKLIKKMDSLGHSPYLVDIAQSTNLDRTI